MEETTAEQLAQLFHETYEWLAPEHGYTTRKASAVRGPDVPANNKSLMIAVAGEVLKALKIEERNSLIYDFETYLLLLAPHSYKDGTRAESLRDRTAQLLMS